jgi:uncharacterized protein
MSTQFVSIEALKRTRRWEFVKPIRMRDLSGHKVLLLHPDSGSWAIIGSQDRPIVEALIEAADNGLLEELPRLEEQPLIEQFVRTGLLLKDGRAAWLPSDFDRSQLPVSLLILKMVGFCNLACTYCYDYNSVTYNRRMTPVIAEKAISQALERAGSRLNILFHGGEPLLAFKEIRSLVGFARGKAAEMGKAVEFSIQTNGTRFTSEVVDFLLSEKFSVGISLDGPPEINDRLRVDHAGRGHHAEIEHALNKYAGLKDSVGVLTTVTRYNVGHLTQAAEYVRDLGIRAWDTTLFQAEGRGESKEDEFSPAADDVIQAYLSLLDGIEEGKFDQIEICALLHYIRNVLFYRQGNMCLRSGGCGAGRDLVSISVDGTIEACDCIKQPELRLGSLHSITIGAALDSPTAKSIRSRSESELETCASCDVRVFCGGTCLAKAGGLTKVDTLECRLALSLFPAIFERIAASSRIEEYARQYP